MSGVETKQNSNRQPKKKSLGARLETVARLVHENGPFDCLCDIGSDHAFIPIRALSSGDAKTAVASDVREGPLERGRANAISAGVFPDFILSDGFSNLGGYRFDAVCICGLGGETIASILDGGKEFVRREDCLLFLQPMTAHDDLRTYLWENGFRICGETFVLEGAKPYVILTAGYTHEPEPFTYTDRFLGQVRPETDAFYAYCEKVKNQTEKRMRGKFRQPGDEDLLQTAAACALKNQKGAPADKP
ncbi:MAG: SAM-dependent methyltransferase [Clostridia bacterium]|nr:SAM-dependent methyltransferase [Clostridia bacterium]